MEGSEKANRRSFMKKTVASSLGVSLASLGLNLTGTSLVQADSPNFSWEKSDSTSYTDGGWNTSLYHSTSVGWYGATYESEKGSWGHDFRLTSTSSARHTEDGSPLDRVDMQYSGVSEGTTDYFFAAISEDHNAVWPSPESDTYDHSDLMLDLAKKAITTLSVYADFALTAADFADKLIPDKSRVDSSDFTYLDKWDYNAEHSDVGHYRLYEAYCGSDESVFSIETQARDSDFGLKPQTNFTFHIRGDYTPDEGTIQSATSTSTTPAGTTLFRPKQGWLVEKIPHQKITERGEALGWPETRTQQHLENEGNPVYFAHQAPVKRVE